MEQTQINGIALDQRPSIALHLPVGAESGEAQE